VVATATGGIPEVVVDLHSGLGATDGPATGRLVPIDQASDGTGTPLDPDQYVADFAAALTQVVTDPALADAMGKAGRQRAIDAFSWTAIADQTVEVYRSVL
jgi:starch synthase